MYCMATRSRHEFWPPFFLLFLFAAAVLNFNLHTINGHTSVCKKKTKIRNCCPQNARVCCLSIALLWRQQLDPLALLETRVGFGYSSTRKLGFFLEKKKEIDK